MLVFVVAYYTLHPGIRRRTKEYRQRIGVPQRALSPFLFCYRHYFEFGKMLVDRAVLGILGEFSMHTSNEDKQLLRELLAKHNKGLIVVTGHVGCWQLGTRGLEDIDAPKAVVLYRNEHDVDRQYYEHQEGEVPPFRVIDPLGPMGGSVEMMEALNQGSIICFMADRNFGHEGSGTLVNFLGGKIEVPTGAYRLASIMGAPMVVTFSRRTGTGTGEIWVSRQILIPPGLGRSSKAYQPYAQMFANDLEAYVKKYPLQFYNFYTMWENTKEE